MYPAEPDWIRAITFEGSVPRFRRAAMPGPVRRWPCRLAAAMCLAMPLAGCAVPPAPPAAAACAAQQTAPMLDYVLFFGRSIPGGGMVGDAAWDDFAARTVTPNLPSGYTIFDAAGAWADPATGRTVHEPTKVLLVAMPDRPDSAAAIARIRDSYRQAFHQESVGMTVAPVCGAF